MALPTSGSWYSVAGPSAEGRWTPMPTASAGGDLLTSVVREHDAGGNPAASTLYAISLADGTSRPLAEFDGRAPDAIWSRDGNRRGRSAARNEGLRQARGRSVPLLDADSYAESDVLERHHAFHDVTGWSRVLFGRRYGIAGSTSSF